MTQAGFDILHPIVPVMFGEEAKAASFAEILLGKGVYVVAFSYPILWFQRARHVFEHKFQPDTREDVKFAVEKFAETKRYMGI